MKTLVKNGMIVSPEDTYEADVLIEDGVIECIGKNLEAKFGDADKVIDAKGKYVLPGGIDVHTHMDIDVGIARAVDDFYTGTVAAACGGTTTIVDHMGFGPAGCPLHHQLDVYHGLADDKAVIDYGFHGVVQHVDESILNELETMMDDGVQSTKVYMTYGYKIDDDGILEVLKKMKELHGITAFHCENHYVVEHLKKEYGDAGKTAPIYHAKSRPNLAEAEAVRRVLYLAKLAGDAPVYIVHLSCKESLEAVEEARKNGQKNIFVETCTQYLTLTEDRYKDPDGLKYIMSPPLRTQQDLDALWKGLESGEIQIVATDHCPFNYAKEKQDGKDDFRKCPNGAPGVEERMILLFSEGVMKNKISINKLVEVACTNPAKVYGMYPKKGIIEPGADGDLVIIDADAKQTLTHEMMHGAVDYTSYEGTDLHGKIDLVMQRGNIIAENNEFKGNRGDGEYLYRKPFLGDL